MRLAAGLHLDPLTDLQRSPDFLPVLRKGKERKGTKIGEGRREGEMRMGRK